MKITDRISYLDFAVFHGILCKHGGRYLTDPVSESNTVFVRYEIEPSRYNEFIQEWNDSKSAPFREIEFKPPSRWTVFWRRVKLFLRGV